MDEHTNEILDIKLEQCRKNLERNQMRTYVVDNITQLHHLLDELIEDETTVNVGGSQTLLETNTIDYLRNRNICFQDRYVEGLTREQVLEIYRKAFLCDTYLCSSNAVTMDGLLVNIDGNGNRVSAMTFGPKQVILIVSTNKIVKNEEEALERIKRFVAPSNAVRLHKNTPCVKTGMCMDCKSKDSICASKVVLSRQIIKDRIKIIFIKEQFGY